MSGTKRTNQHQSRSGSRFPAAAAACRAHEITGKYTCTTNPKSPQGPEPVAERRMRVHRMYRASVNAKAPQTTADVGYTVVPPSSSSGITEASQDASHVMHREESGPARKEQRKRSLCQHQKRRSRCRECGGASICSHNRERSKCQECGGASICPHKRERSQCKECGGASICPHQRIRSSCKECGGTSICPHLRQRSQCKECGGASICEHQRQRSKCKECGGASVCPHQRQRSKCRECVKSRK